MRLTELNRELTDRLLSELRTQREYQQRWITPTGVPCLMFRITKGGQVTFRLRKYVEGTRCTHRLPPYRPGAFVLKDVETAAYKQLAAWDEHGAVPVEEAPTVAGLLSLYEQRRLDGKEKRRSKGLLAVDWEEHVALFKKVYAPILKLNVKRLTQALLEDTRTKYLRNEQPEGELNYKKLGPMCATVKPAFERAVKNGWITGAVLEGFIPEKYDDGLRYLLPGEWQAACPALDAMPHGAGKFIRFLFLNGMRNTNALEMKWADLDTITNHVEFDGQKFEVRRLRVDAEDMKANEDEVMPFVGEALDIIKYFDADRKARDKTRETVFSPEVISIWGQNASRTQRQLEAAIGYAPKHGEFTRRDMRRTHATYLGLIDTPDVLVSLSLSHTLPKRAERQSEGAAVTAIYNRADQDTPTALSRSKLNMADGSSGQALILKLLQMQRLLADIEAGEVTPMVERVQDKILDGKIANRMMKKHKVDRKFMVVQPKTTDD